ncbi:hypothetical protein DFH11DRAFT_922405 [Phellopilus nigrolimitatus]|nr:hypothetical protein DFH11DRAFT_922405 [Phellopilus nigrolimitatus]
MKPDYGRNILAQCLNGAASSRPAVDTRRPSRLLHQQRRSHRKQTRSALRSKDVKRDVRYSLTRPSIPAARFQANREGPSAVLSLTVLLSQSVLSPGARCGTTSARIRALSQISAHSSLCEAASPKVRNGRRERESEAHRCSHTRTESGNSALAARVRYRFAGETGVDLSCTCTLLLPASACA